MNERNGGFEIKASQRQNWISIAMVWAGGMICVPCLMVGGVLSSGGLSIAQMVASILIGYGLICAYMICIGMQACDTGLPVAVMAEGALGKQGALYYQSAAFYSLYWLVWYSVGYMRKYICVHAGVYAGDGSSRSGFDSGVLHYLGSDYAGYGMCRF